MTGLLRLVVEGEDLQAEGAARAQSILAMEATAFSMVEVRQVRW